MAGALFAIVFRNGLRIAVRGGDAHDFIDYPAGYGPSDIVDIDCDIDRHSPYVSLPEYRWCLFS